MSWNYVSNNTMYKSQVTECKHYFNICLWYSNDPLNLLGKIKPLAEREVLILSFKKNTGWAGSAAYNTDI